MIRVLVAIANPRDLSQFDDARLWAELTSALPPGLQVERLTPATEGALRLSLSTCHWDVVHVAAHTQAHGAARYGSVALEGSDGNARNVTAEFLAGVFAAAPPGIVILESGDAEGGSFDPLVDAMVARSLPVLALDAGVTGEKRRLLLAELYADLAARPAAGGIVQPVSTPREVAVPVAAVAVEEPWHAALRTKRAAGRFDVFLCHNSVDKPAVKQIGQRLREKGLLPWLDAWELPPGQPWQPLLEKQIGSIRAAAVFVGTAGMGPWQEQEMYGFLRAFVSRKIPVIPVMLPNAPERPELPIFLQAMTWVDFRNADPDPLGLLSWGITGERPED